MACRVEIFENAGFSFYLWTNENGVFRTRLCHTLYSGAHPVSIEGSLSHLQHFRVSVWMGKHDLNLLGVEEYLFFFFKKKNLEKTLR